MMIRLFEGKLLPQGAGCPRGLI